MVGVGVQGLAVMWRRLALKPLARGVHFLCLLCCSRSRTTGIFLPFHFARVLQAPTLAFVTTLLRLGDDLCPLL
jgi:hypothetical protein